MPGLCYNSQRFDMTPKTLGQRRTLTRPPPKNRAAQALGRLGGTANTPAQNQARKQNARLAGRPRRICRRCGEPVVGGHADRALDESCGRHGWQWAKAGSGKGRR